MSVERRTILRFDHGTTQPAEDELVVEEPLEIRVRGRAISVTMRTPGNDEDLAAGFLLSEGVIRQAGDILKIDPCGRNEMGNLVNVQLAPQVHVDFDRLTRHVFASSSCGLCGKATIEALANQFAPMAGTATVSAEVLLSLPQKMREAQSVFERTGGLHAAGLFDRGGNLLVLREDVGRHNAVDKVLGHVLLRGLPADDRILLVSGRASFEIMQKALAGRVAAVAAVSAPSSLAVEFAEQNRQILIGFLRTGRMNVYTGVERVRFSE